MSWPKAPYISEGVIAYHGTSRQAARSIVRERRFKPSSRDYEWLGTAAYFFHSFHRARQWAIKHHDEPAVVTAHVRLGHCIDLTDNRWSAPVAATEENLTSRLHGVRMSNIEGRHYLDNAVINVLAELWQADTIRAAFSEGHPLGPSQSFHEATHIQIAVRNQEHAFLELSYEEEWHDR